MTITFLVYVAIALLALPVFVLLVQVVAALFSDKEKLAPFDVEKRPSIGVLMPAYNESLVIAPSIKSIQSQLQAQDELIVIADNCTDDTAAIARGLGAIVLERFNQNERGKGYALDFGLQFLRDIKPEVVLILDADCLVSEGATDSLVKACVQYQRPVQALYLMESQPNPSLKARVASFAWTVKNKVRPLGSRYLGLPCQLMGTGMAFLWEDINKVSLASGHIVEDMKLGVDLARKNKATLFNDDALVTSIFPPGEAATITQRSRWEHGHLAVIINELPKLLWEAIKTRNAQMLGLACDLLIPPLAMLTLACVAILLASALVGGKIMILLSVTLVLTLILSVLIAWLKFGREIISFKALCYAPIYALIKIPIYIKFFLDRQVEWVRSKRD